MGGYFLAMAQHMRRIDRLYQRIDEMRETIARERLLRRLGEPEPPK
jgi:hypothetical protein